MVSFELRPEALCEPQSASVRILAANKFSREFERKNRPDEPSAYGRRVNSLENLLMGIILASPWVPAYSPSA